MVPIAPLRRTAGEALIESKAVTFIHYRVGLCANEV